MYVCVCVCVRVCHVCVYACVYVCGLCPGHDDKLPEVPFLTLARCVGRMSALAIRYSACGGSSE